MKKKFEIWIDSRSELYLWATDKEDAEAIAKQILFWDAPRNSARNAGRTLVAVERRVSEVV